MKALNVINGKTRPVFLRVTEEDFRGLAKFAALDQRSVSAVATLLLRHALSQCQSVDSFRKILDSRVSADQQVQPLTQEPVQHRGVIRGLQQLLLEAKEQNCPLTSAELHAKLVERCGGASIVTVRAQINRMPTERAFPIQKFRDGSAVRYAAK
jgi:hypothetical protein